MNKIVTEFSLGICVGICPVLSDIGILEYWISGSILSTYPAVRDSRL
jgi:hypothetical protein